MSLTDRMLGITSPEPRVVRLTLRRWGIVVNYRSALGRRLTQAYIRETFGLGQPLS